MFWKKSKSDVHPQWLIVGLGNPGGEYTGTRHNVGFEVIDGLSGTHRIRMDRSKHRARIGFGRIGDSDVCLVKPLTFMNLSGQAVAPLARDFGILPDHVIVVADDMDLKTGQLRLRESGSAGGHNGHKSVIQYLKTQDYPRIRIGIGKSGSAIEHVLSRFDPDEKTLIERAVKATQGACEVILAEGVQAAQRVIEEHNRRSD